jgi:hypothetical protein
MAKQLATMPIVHPKFTFVNIISQIIQKLFTLPYIRKTEKGGVSNAKFETPSVGARQI